MRMKACEGYGSERNRMKAYLERSHLKLHTFWRDQAIYIKQPKVLAIQIKAYINANKTS